MDEDVLAGERTRGGVAAAHFALSLLAVPLGDWVWELRWICLGQYQCADERWVHVTSRWCILNKCNISFSGCHVTRDCRIWIQQPDVIWPQVNNIRRQCSCRHHEFSH